MLNKSSERMIKIDKEVQNISINYYRIFGLELLSFVWASNRMALDVCVVFVIHLK